MARVSKEERLLLRLVSSFLQLPFKVRIGIAVLVLIAGLCFLVVYSFRHKPAPPEADKGGADLSGGGTVVLCHWNMENLFDDRDDKRRQPDEEYDSWFVNDPEARKLKYQRLTEALLKLNNGVGPDIVVGNEIESYRAAELLKDSLNANLPTGTALR
jgi:hypothetical protein